MGSDSLELVSSTPRTIQDNAPMASFHGSGSFLPLQPLEPSAEKLKAKVSIHDSQCLVFPSPSQQAAVTILQDFDDAKIFNCLSVLRSLSPHYQQSPHSENLSMQQLTALSTLKDCQKEDVVACLEACRRGSAGSFQVSPGNADNNLHPATAPFSPEFRPASSASLTGLSNRNPCPLTFYGGANTCDNTPRSSSSHANSFVDLSRENSHVEGAASISGAGHQHWCTVCEKPSPISTCDGWKRHEKEKHEKGYMCMPKGPVENTNSGLHCAFCGLLNPSHEHLEIHNVRLCTDKPNKDRRYTRKLGLINHLKTHGTFEASALADRWRVWLKKRFCACGFCVSIFSTNGDRLNHIDSHHYRHYQHIDDWDLNTVIKGLLLQPEVLASWKLICPWDPDPRYANLVWNSHAVATLQLRLELSEESAHKLATDAFYQSSVNFTQGIQAMASLVGSVPNQQTDNCERLSVEEQQPHTVGPHLPSYPPIDTQAKDVNPLHPLGHLLPWNATKTDTIDPVHKRIHPPQSLPAFPGLANFTDYPSDAMPMSFGQSHRLTNDPTGNRSSQNSSNVGATGVFQYGNALGQFAPTSLESWQGSSSGYVDNSNPIELTPPPVSYVARSDEIGKPDRTAASPSVHGSPSTSFTTVTTMTGLAKPPSIGAKVKRRISRLRRGIDVDDVMLHMHDDESSRSVWPSDRRSK